MTTDRPSSILFICDFAPGFSGAKHHDTGVGGTEALVVVLAERLGGARRRRDGGHTDRGGTLRSRRAVPTGHARRDRVRRP